MLVPGATLSRWTMSYFAAALLCLLLEQTMLAAGWWQPSVDIGEPRVLIIVHFVTIGWFGLLMIGALLQFSPVLTGLGLPTERLNLVCLLALIIGLATLSFGFEAIEREWPFAGTLMVAAVSMLASAFLAIAMVLFIGLWRGRSVHTASPFVMMAIVCLAATVTLGAIFALVISGVTQTRYLVELVLDAVPLHMSFGLAGWMTFAAIGVSYKLLPMFLLSPDTGKSGLVRNSGASALAILCLALVLSTAGSGLVQPLMLAAAITFAITLTAYLVDVTAMYRRRRRKIPELNTLGSIPAFALLAASALAFVVSIPLGLGPNVRIALIYVFAFGWLTGLGLAQLLKIVPFLTWIEAFGPLLGRRPTPRLSELVRERHAAVWLALFYLGVILAGVAIAGNSDSGFRAAAVLQAFCTAALAFELFRARALLNIDGSAKTAPFRQPALLVAKQIQRGNANDAAS